MNRDEADALKLFIETAAEVYAERAVSKLRAELLGEIRERGIYRGVWAEDTLYERATLITHRGQLWHAQVATIDRPGTSDNWKMMHKHPGGRPDTISNKD